MTPEQAATLARTLDEAWDGATTVPAPTLTEPTLTTEEAYAVQDMLIARRVGAGRRVAGWKLGLTSADPPTTPIVGTLLDDMIVTSGSRLAMTTMVAPMVEAEFVVRIGETIDRPQTVADLERGPHQVGPGIEVIDYRTVDSQGPVDWIADNSTVAYAVVGELVPVSGVDPVAVISELFLGDTLLASGPASKVMGNPLAAVAWLSGHLLERGRTLSEGDVVLTGSLTGHHRVPSGNSTFTADFADLGVVSIGFDDHD